MAIQFRGSATATDNANASIQVTMPAGATVGDYVIVAVSFTNNSASQVVVTTPAGWTLLRRDNYRNSTVTDTALTYGRVLTTLSNFVATHNGVSGQYAAAAYAYSGVNATPVDVSAATLTTGGTATFPSVTTTVANDLVLRIQSQSGNGGFPPAAPTGHTQRGGVLQNTGSIQSVVLADIAAPSAGATGTATQQSYAQAAAITLALSPAQNVTPSVRTATTGSTGSAALSLNTPAGYVAGDYLMAHCRFPTGYAGTVTPPSGFTLIASANGARLYGKVATASEPVQQVFTLSPSSNAAGGLLLVADQNTSAPVASVTGPTLVSGTTTTASAPSTSGVVGGLLLALFGNNGPTGADPTATAPTGMTAVVGGEVSSSGGSVASYYQSLASTAATGVKSITYAVSTTDTTGYALIIAGANSAPNAPTLTAPANAAYQDLAAGFTFTWTFSDPNASDAQSAYAFRRKISGAGSYEYWNVGTSAFQSTIVWNASTAGSITFGAGLWTDGNVYNWSVATQDNAPTPLQGPFAADNTVSASGPPTVTVTAPTGTQVTQQPIVNWADVTQSGLSESQTAYRVVVESGGYGATPGSGVSVYDSTVVTSGVTTLTIPASLPNTVTYRAFVQVTVTGGQTSGWGYSTFTVAVDGPAVPVLTGSFDPALQRSVLALQGRDNLLSLNQSSLETDTTGWLTNGNCSISRSTAQSLDGVASLAMSSTAAGEMLAITTGGLGSSPVIAGQTYTAVASFRAAVSPRSCRVEIVWYDSGGAQLSFAAGASVTDSTTGWTQAFYTAVAPIGAAFGSVMPSVLATGAAAEVHYVDQISIAPGASTVWTRGGLAGSAVAIVERSLDSGATWAAIRQSGPVLPAPSQAVTVYDVEPPPNAAVLYRTRAQVVV